MFFQRYDSLETLLWMFRPAIIAWEMVEPRIHEMMNKGSNPYFVLLLKFNKLRQNLKYYVYYARAEK